MPEADFTADFQRSQAPEFDRLKLRVGETARVVLLEKPTYAWTHTLRAPKIVDGLPVMAKRKRRGSDEEFDDFDLDFIGRPQCLGDLGTLASDGVDPANCPVCKRAKESEQVYAPERRYAVNVIRYSMDRNGNLVSPFSCTCVVWTFPEGVFNKLYAINTEHGQLLGIDLLLGPCEAPESFQRYAITAGAKHIWALNEQVKQYVVETYQNNRVGQLEAACGRQVEIRWLREDLERVRERWDIANRRRNANGGVPVDGTESADLTAGLGALLATPAAAPAQPAVDLAAMLGGPVSGVPAPPVMPVVSAPPVTSAPPVMTHPQPPSPIPSPFPPPPAPAPGPPAPPSPPVPAPGVAPAPGVDVAALMATEPTATAAAPAIDFDALLSGLNVNS